MATAKFFINKTTSIKTSNLLSWQPLKVSMGVVKCAAEISSPPVAPRRDIDAAVRGGWLPFPQLPVEPTNKMRVNSGSIQQESTHLVPMHTHIIPQAA